MKEFEVDLQEKKADGPHARDLPPFTLFRITPKLGGFCYLRTSTGFLRLYDGSHYDLGACSPVFADSSVEVLGKLVFKF